MGIVFLSAWIYRRGVQLFTSAWHQPVGIICGSALGLITVWFAASSPARAGRQKLLRSQQQLGMRWKMAADSPCHARLFGSRAELSLGVSHATSSQKNLLLMTGSFALSILLFLSFSVLLRWVGFALNPLQPYTPDLSVAETSGQNVLDPVLVEQLEALPEVKHAFGRMYCPLPAEYQGKQGSIDLISYDTIQFGWAKKDLIGGIPLPGAGGWHIPCADGIRQKQLPDRG